MKAERAIGIYSSLFAEQVLGLWSDFSRGGVHLFFSRVEFHQLGQVELGLLEYLDLADEDVLKWEDLVAFLLNLLANLVGEPKIIIINTCLRRKIYVQLLEDSLEGVLCDLVEHNLHHLLADEFLL